MDLSVGGFLAILGEARGQAAATMAVRPSIGLSILKSYLDDAAEWVVLRLSWEADQRSRRDQFEDWLVERYAASMPALRETADYHYLQAEWERL